MPSLTLKAVPFIPSAPLSGNETSAIYRGKNMKLRGVFPDVYYEAYSGSENLGEYIPAVAATGTFAFSPSSDIVTGTGTDVLGELHIGQMLLANVEVLVVAELLTATTFRNARLPVTTETTATGTRLPILFPLDVKRGAMLRGNALHSDRGTILVVGDGILYVNGSVLPGDSLTATRRLQAAFYDSSVNTYDVQPVGFTTTPTIANTAVTIVASGGTKNMSLGFYSTKVGYYSDLTNGFSNGTATLLSGGLTGYNVTVANSTFNFNFTADAGSRPTNATGYVIYFSAFSGLSATSAVNSIQGGWFEVRRVPFTSLVANQTAFDFVDADMTTLVSFDNDEPPDAEFIGSLDLYPFLISTNGRGEGSGTRKESTSPGPFVAPIKSGNFDAYPARVRVPTEKGETIIGQVSAAGRIFVLTANTLQAVTPTGLPSAPFTCRPFWKRGFQGVFNLCFFDDTLYGFATAGMFRSIATGDQASAANDFAANVQSQTASWHGGYVFVEGDLKNEEVCFFYSASRQNAQGYWESDIYPYSLAHTAWQPPIILSDPTRDMIVSGVASVNGHLEFIAGGRREGTTNRHDTWRYDTGSNVDVPYYLAWNFMDNGVETISKILHKIRVKGKFTSAKVQVYATTPNSVIDITDVETGANPTYEFNLDDSTAVTQYKINKCRVHNALMWTVRIEGTSTFSSDASYISEQFHEVAIDLSVAGQQR